MAAWRRAIELSLGDADTAKLRSIAQSRTEPASRVERALILLAYREDPSFFAVGRALGPADGNNTFVLVAVPQRTHRTPVFNASNANTGGGMNSTVTGRSGREREAKIGQLVDANIIGIFIARLDGDCPIIEGPAQR